MTDLIAITGATGSIGGRVARLLAAEGQPLRLIARQPDKAPKLPGSDVRFGDYGDGKSMTAALAGAKTMLLVSGREAFDRLQHHRSAVDAAAAAGVEKVVYTSFLGAASDSTFTLGRQHWHTEQHIMASGMRWVFLRNSLYLDVIPHLPGSDGVIRGPAGEGRLGAVAREDVVHVAVATLRDDSHDGQIYHLTGPEAFNLYEAAELLTRAFGREISYYPESEEEAYASRAIYNAPAFEVEGWVTSYLAIANGEMESVTNDVERVAGHPPMSLASFLDTHPESYFHLFERRH